MHNLVTVVMRQFNTDIQAAINWIGDLHDRIAKEFLDEWKNIPTYGGPLDLEVRTYCYGLGNWVRANDSWSFEVSSFKYLRTLLNFCDRVSVILESKVFRFRNLGRSHSPNQLSTKMPVLSSVTVNKGPRITLVDKYLDRAVL